MRKFGILVIFSLFLTACGSNPQSYITAKKEPIINIEASINDSVDIEAKSEKLSITNVAKTPINIIYKLFWYDQKGVTQAYSAEQESSGWNNLWLKSYEKREVSLHKPTRESVNYRVYLRGSR